MYSCKGVWLRTYAPTTPDRCSHKHHCKYFKYLRHISFYLLTQSKSNCIFSLPVALFHKNCPFPVRAIRKKWNENILKFFVVSKMLLFFFYEEECVCMYLFLFLVLLVCHKQDINKSFYLYPVFNNRFFVYISCVSVFVCMCVYAICRQGTSCHFVFYCLTLCGILFY